MSSLQIEQRLSKLEAEVSQLKQALLNSTIPTKPWWEDITGIFADDPAFEEAMALGLEYRQSTVIEAETPETCFYRHEMGTSV